MPFIQRVLEPVYLSRKPLRTEDGRVIVNDYELEAVNNNTLSSALKQLASLVLIANDIFAELTKQLSGVCERSRKLRTRIDDVAAKVTAFNPKTVTVPESDICTFSLLREHFTAPNTPSGALFTPSTRPRALQDMYDACVKTPVHVMREMDAYRRDGARSSRYFMCTPVMGGRRKRRHRDIEIETSKPAAFDDLRRWTSTEALGDVTVAPDCSSRITPCATSVIVDLSEEIDAPTSRDDATDHKLPSPEEQVQVVALHFPAQMIPVDVSGRAFARMSSVRRSVGLDGTVHRRERGRRPRGKRRNTIAACTDKKELEDAIVAGASPNDSQDTDVTASTSHGRSVTRTRSGDVRSRSSDILRSKTDSSPPDKKSHFNSLRQWGSAKLKLIRGKSQELHPKSPPMPEDFNIYEAIHKGKKSEPKKSTKSSLPISTSSGAMSMAVKLREREGSLRRQQRAAAKDEPIHSSSGNWSASSESGRASVGSETTTATPQPKSTTMSSPGTSSQSLHQAPSSVSSRRRFNTSTSSSFSEGTLTPDIGSDLPFVDDGENSSIYSCDTEGYYTSFHLDSGLKPLKEEDTPMTPLHSTTALSHSPRTLSAENEYELFGKGSTSTTTSSAGTVCTTLLAGNNDSSLSLVLAPAVPERKSSLETKSDAEKIVVAMIHKELVSYSPDSGHNTSSSPVDSTSSPHGTMRSSEYEFSESDFEGVERIERIRVKTTIHSSNIPSMCVITPPQSDDEISLSHYVPFSRNTEDRQNDEPLSYYSSLPRKLEKQISSDSSENDYAKVNKKRTINKNDLKLNFLSNTQTTERIIQETHFDVEVTPEAPKQEDGSKKTPPQPLDDVAEKIKNLLVSKSLKKTEETDVDDGMSDSGDYVTIADVRQNKNINIQQALYENCANTKSPVLGRIRETEYVSLNELPSAISSVANSNPLQAPIDSLERKKRQGARVTLDAEGKVVYSSDSLKRVKGHSTFEPGPYIKETILTPTASPIPLHRVPKSNIRPVNLQGRNSPLPMTIFPATYTDKTPSPILLRKNQLPTRNRLSPNSPKLGKVIIRTNSPATRVVSPVSMRPMSPKSTGKVVSTRSISPKAVGKVVSPVARRSASPKMVVSPTSTRPMSPKAINTRGAYVHMLSTERCVSPPRSSLDYAVLPQEEAGLQHPPRYVNPPSAHTQTNSQQPINPSHNNSNRWRHFNPPNYQIPPYSSPSDPKNTYWTLPARKSQEVIVDAPRSLTPNSYQHADWHADGIHHNSVGVRHQSREQSFGATVRKPYVQQSSTTRPFSQSSLPPNPVYPIHSAKIKPQQRNLYSKPASIPHVPINGIGSISQTYRGNHHPKSSGSLQSSTPNKEHRHQDEMDFSRNFSPIQKHKPKCDVGDGPVNRSRLISAPKTKMTSEEIFALIHKSKKRLNIKTDVDCVSRSSSPATSLSPGSSETSINGRAAENVLVSNASRGRNSWSPNSSEYYDFYEHFENRASTPIAAGSRQSWACDRLGPTQPTTRNDFKRLLLQHGPTFASKPDQHTRLSAVEQLKLTRQQKLASSPTQPRSPVDKRGGKFMQAPRSPAWRFASPRTDVLSSTILEDCDEEERAERSPHNSPPRGSSTPHLTNPNVRRPLDIMFNTQNVPFQTSPAKNSTTPTLNNPSTRRHLDTLYHEKGSSQNYPQNESPSTYFKNPSVCKPMEPLNGHSQNYQYLRNLAPSSARYQPSVNSSKLADTRVSAIPLPGESFPSSQPQIISNHILNSYGHSSSVIPPTKKPLPINENSRNMAQNVQNTPNSNAVQSASETKISPRELFFGYQQSSSTDSSSYGQKLKDHIVDNKYLQFQNKTHKSISPSPSNHQAQQSHYTSNNDLGSLSQLRIGNHVPNHSPYVRSDKSLTTSSKYRPTENVERFSLPIYNKCNPPELLSPSNVKENFNSYQIQSVNNASPSKSILSHTSTKHNGIAIQPTNSKSNVLTSNQRTTSQSTKTNTSPRNILGTIDSKSPQKVSLETSL